MASLRHLQILLCASATGADSFHTRTHRDSFVNGMYIKKTKNHPKRKAWLIASMNERRFNSFNWRIDNEIDNARGGNQVVAGIPGEGPLRFEAGAEYPRGIAE